jgi:hypothetical protein
MPGLPKELRPERFAFSEKVSGSPGIFVFFTALFSGIWKPGLHLPMIGWFGEP